MWLRWSKKHQLQSQGKEKKSASLLIIEFDGWLKYWNFQTNVEVNYTRLWEYGVKLVGIFDLF